jgi:3-deoxy-manno-octulosonate cytidylyltransferase (CMP-KDO synthetase)
MLPKLRPSKLEEMEALEQLRLLENGIPIQVVEVAQDSIGVDILEDLDRVRPLLENELKKSKKG